MAGIKDKMGKLKNWMIVDNDNANDDYDSLKSFNFIEGGEISLSH